MIWRRIKGWFRNASSGEVETGEPPTLAERDEATRGAPSAAELLGALAETSEAPDGARAVALFDELHRAGGTAKALELSRRLMRKHGPLPAFSLRVAQALSERGDEEAALQVLGPLIGSADPPLAALMLAAEIRERRGAWEDARRFYEQVLARDVDYPQARERARHLAERMDRPRNVAGATLALDGALARGRYRVERELGRGGAGTVLGAVDLRLQRRVALKVYHRRGPTDRERLRMEARTPAGLEHPGVIRVFDVDLGLGAIVMEWVQGGAVRRELARGKVARRRVERWLRTALEAIEFVHRCGYVHLDLKPSNFLLRDDDRVVLTDFGLAVAIGATPASTRGRGEGTLRYMPPEQRHGAPAQPSADVHAFGVSLRELVEACDDAPPEWSELAAACACAEPAARPSVAALRHALR